MGVTLSRFMIFTIFVLCGIAATSAASPPNVLLLISDDLNTYLGCYGDERAQTPNLDRLAARGVRFDRAYCQYPLCGPSRNSMLTGLYPNSTGILANSQIFRQTIPSHPSLSQCFRLAGYFAARIGKLYHYNVPKSVGTNGHDDPGSWELELNPAGVDRLVEEADTFSVTPGRFGASLSWYASPRPDAQHTDGMLASDAQWVLERCARDRTRPFFLAVGFFRPHTPYVAPEPYFDKYPLQAMPVVSVTAADQADVPEPALASRREVEEQLSGELRRKAVQAYYASISFMDAQVGHVIDALDRLGLAENTIVVFTSDHGYHMGEHGLWQKMSLFENSARVPLIVAGPGVAAGSVVEEPVGLIDVYPTLSRMCNVPAPDNLQGQNLLPMLKDAAATGRGWALTQVQRPGTKGSGQFFGYSLRTPRWRYTEWAEGDRGRELYDHQAEPGESRNLADDLAHASTVADLSKKLREAVKSTYPASGKTPQLRDGLWAPNLTDP